jgi:hypothetical protein
MYSLGWASNFPHIFEPQSCVEDRADRVDSQGGQLVHNAAKKMTASQTNAVSSGEMPSNRT